MRICDQCIRISGHACFPSTHPKRSWNAEQAFCVQSIRVKVLQTLDYRNWHLCMRKIYYRWEPNVYGVNGPNAKALYTSSTVRRPLTDPGPSNSCLPNPSPLTMILVSLHSDLGQVSKEAPKEIVLTITGCFGQAVFILLSKKSSKASLLQRMLMHECGDLISHITG